MAYVIDTNVFIEAKNKYYGFEFCPAFWHWVLDAANRQVALSVKPVLKELAQGDDQLSVWAKTHKDLFLPSDNTSQDSLQMLSTWAQDHFNDAACNAFFSAADFSIIAYAHTFNHTVVTHETRGAGHAIKMPNACKALNVRCVNPFEMLRAEKARFVLEKNKNAAFELLP